MIFVSIDSIAFVKISQEQEQNLIQINQTFIELKVIIGTIYRRIDSNNTINSGTRQNSCRQLGRLNVEVRLGMQSASRPQKI